MPAYERHHKAITDFFRRIKEETREFDFMAPDPTDYKIFKHIVGSNSLQRQVFLAKKFGVSEIALSRTHRKRINERLREFSNDNGITPAIQLYFRAEGKYPGGHFSCCKPTGNGAISTNPEPLAKLTHTLERAAERILRKEPTNSTGFFSHNFKYLAEKFREIDQNLLPLIRDHRHAPIALVAQEFRDLLHRRLEKSGISLEEFDRLIHDQGFQAELMASIPKPSLTVKVSDNIDNLTFICPSGEELAIKSPELLWDCNCEAPHEEEEGDFECPIHSHPLGAEVDSRFASGYVQIEYRGLKFYWRCNQELWPPSIDSFHMIRAMEEDGLFEYPYQSVLDLGSGTGFLGIVAAIFNPYVTHLTLSDWLLTPYLYGAANWVLNSRDHDHITYKGKIGLLTTGLDPTGSYYDVVVCNPPYLPLLKGFDFIGMHSIVAGTDLLTHLIANGKAIGRKVYLQFSHIALPEAEATAKKVGVKLRPVGPEKEVPFRVTVAWSRTDYLEALLKERGLIEKKGTRHRFWHRIQTYVIE